MTAPAAWTMTEAERKNLTLGDERVSESTKQPVGVWLDAWGNPMFRDHDGKVYAYVQNPYGERLIRAGEVVYVDGTGMHPEYAHAVIVPRLSWWGRVRQWVRRVLRRAERGA